MNIKKLMKNNPDILKCFSNNGMTWHTDGLTTTYEVEGLSIKMHTDFNRRVKNLHKEMDKRINLIQSQKAFCDYMIPALKERYDLVSNDDFIQVLNAHVFNMDNEKYYEVIANDLEKLSLEKETSIFESIEDYPRIFPKARKRQRKIIAYLGETNSGKTYSAMNKLAASAKGAYLAPLRLLAYENYEYLNAQGVDTNLITGEERILEHEQPQCVSSTVECFSHETDYETVVIDEIQMMDDHDRGAFFVQALVGANAKNVIVTGPLDYTDRLTHIANELGEEIEIHTFERKSELKPIKQPKDLKDITKNTALVVFSRKDIFKMRKKLPADLKCSLIYGALGYEVRRLQAERFINGETDVLISTDAIGMGMNLPIENIIFSTYKKFNGRKFTSLGDMLTKQIAGRAGRYGLFDIGYYGALDEETLQYVKHVMKRPLSIDCTKKLNVNPTQHYLKVLLNKYKLSSILEDWTVTEKFSPEGLFCNASQNDKIAIARFLEKHYPDKVYEYLNIIHCPVDYEKDHDFFNMTVHTMFKNNMLSMPEKRDSNASLATYEVFLKQCGILFWFSNQFPHFCIGGVEKYQIKLKDIIADTNEKLNDKLIRSS